MLLILKRNYKVSNSLRDLVLSHDYSIETTSLCFSPMSLQHHNWYFCCWQLWLSLFWILSTMFEYIVHCVLYFIHGVKIQCFYNTLPELRFLCLLHSISFIVLQIFLYFLKVTEMHLSFLLHQNAKLLNNFSDIRHV